MKGKNTTFLLLAALLLQFSSYAEGKILRYERLVRSVSDAELKSLDEIPGELITATFNQTIEDAAKNNYVIIYKFYYEESQNLTTALRINVISPDSVEAFPLFFAVRQQQQALSWQVPLILENIYASNCGYAYRNVSRTLCPLENKDKTKLAITQEVQVEITTLSPVAVDFKLLVHIVEHFIVETEVEYGFEVSPAEPKYYQYTMPANINSVVVKADSPEGSDNSDICMVMSIQSTKCPVFDLAYNVDFQGTYQSITSQGAITISREDLELGGFVDNSFFVVFVVLPSDFECTRIAPFCNATDFLHRTKTVSLEVEEQITRDDFILAILGAFLWFLVFYVAAALIFLISWFYLGKEASRSHDLPQDLENLTSSDTPIANDIHGASKYGSTAASGEQMEQVAEHRSEDINHVDNMSEADYDQLEDIEREKDVFRTKSEIFVSDLSRKEPKALHKKYKLYHWNLITISIFYILPVIQLVLTYQRQLNITGNEDLCYYNFQCIHQLKQISAFNSVYSNIGYVMLGLLFLLIVKRRETLYKRACKKNPEIEMHSGIPQHFGLYYAMGIALVMEGFLSACYHVCPSYTNFQFDTSFMYMIGWLLMLKIYQTRHPDISPQAYIAYFSIAVVIFIAVIGVFFGTLLFRILFTIFHLLITMFLTIQIYYMGRWKVDSGIFKRIWLVVRSDILRCSAPVHKDRMVLLVIGNLINWGIAIYGLISLEKDFSTYLLTIFLVNLLMYFAFYIIMKLLQGEKILAPTWIYILVASVLWASALFFFHYGQSTSWQLTPADSRAHNRPCTILHFYDAHDIWHFLSAMSLFMSFIVLLTLDDALDSVPRNQILVF